MRHRLHTLLSLLVGTYREYLRDNGSINAAAITFYTAMSLVPIALLGVSVLGHLIGSSSRANDLVRSFVTSVFPGATADQVLAALRSGRIEGLGLVSAVSAAGLVWAGVNLFALLSRVLTTIWVGAPHRGFLAQRVVGLFSLFIAGLLFLANVFVTSFVAAVSQMPVRPGPFAEAIHFLESAFPWIAVGVLAFLSFLLVYRFLPAGHVDTRAALLAALPAAVFWLISRYVFRLLVAGSANYGRIYGPLAGAIVLLLWIYVSAILMIVCAELGEVLQERYWPAPAEERPAGMV